MTADDLRKLATVKLVRRTDAKKGETTHQVIEAREGGKKIGWLTHHKGGDDGDYQWLKGMYVAPSHRGTGLGHKLMVAAIEDNTGKELRLRAKPFEDKPLSGQQLQKFYSKHGFKTYDEKGRMKRKGE